MSVRDYTEATYKAIQNTGEEKEILSRLRTHLKKSGREALYARILRKLAEKFEQRERHSAPTLIVNSEHDAKKDAQTHKEILELLKVTEPTTIRTDSSLIGGFIMRIDGKEVDMSYKKALLDAYHRIIN